ncbi:hypothetical protein [Actinorhabdospora filicis]|nr:hypothetical protein [Actinorhabdospora filicis]
MALQRAAGNRAVASLLGRPAVQRAMAVPAVQGTAQLRQRARDKLNAVHDVLARMGPGIPGPNFQLLLTVTNYKTASPAYTQLAANGDIQVTLEKWYLRGSSIGEIVGLCCHELGVHELADKLLSPAERGLEANAGTADEQVPGTAFGMRPGRTFRLGAYTGAADPRQLDHVNIARFASPRRQVYEDTMVSAGDAIDATAGISLDEKRERHLELVKTFLFDVARIIVTDDGGPEATFANRDAITEVMLAYRRQLIATHRQAHPWIASPVVRLMRPGEVLGKLVDFAWHFVTG